MPNFQSRIISKKFFKKHLATFILVFTVVHSEGGAKSQINVCLFTRHRSVGISCRHQSGSYESDFTSGNFLRIDFKSASWSHCNWSGVVPVFKKGRGSQNSPSSKCSEQTQTPFLRLEDKKSDHKKAKNAFQFKKLALVFGSKSPLIAGFHSLYWSH